MRAEITQRLSVLPGRALQSEDADFHPFSSPDSAEASTLCVGGGGPYPFSGTASINCFGCGSSSGTADLTLLDTGGAVHADYDVTEPSITCPLTGSATGTTTGAINVNFTWTRTGATAVISTTGDVNGVGAAAFAAATPLPYADVPTNPSIA